MKQWQISAKETINLVDTTKDLEEGFVKVKVTKSAISSTDIALYLNKTKTDLPKVPSRIASGLISEASDESGFKKGERVLLSPYINEKENKLNEAETMSIDFDGYLADYVVVPEDNVYTLPDGVSDEEALFVEYIALASKTLNVLNTQKQDYLAIFGANALSNVIAQLAIYNKIIPILISEDKDKLDIAKKCGIYYLIDSKKENVKNKVKEITGGEFVNSTIFACRATQAPPMAFDITKYNGNVGIIGYNTFVNKLSADMRPILLNNLSIFGINNGMGNIETALNLLANKAVNIDLLINKTYEFDEADKAFNVAVKEQNKYMKLVINC